MTITRDSFSERHRAKSAVCNLAPNVAASWEMMWLKVTFEQQDRQQKICCGKDQIAG